MQPTSRDDGHRRVRACGGSAEIVGARHQHLSSLVFAFSCRMAAGGDRKGDTCSPPDYLAFRHAR